MRTLIAFPITMLSPLCVATIRAYHRHIKLLFVLLCLVWWLKFKRSWLPTSRKQKQNNMTWSHILACIAEFNVSFNVQQWRNYLNATSSLRFKYKNKIKIWTTKRRYENAYKFVIDIYERPIKPRHKQNEFTLSML